MTAVVVSGCGTTSSTHASASTSNPSSSSASANSSTSSNSSSGSGKVVTLKLYTGLNGPIAGTNERLWQNVLDPVFEKLHPNIRIEVTSYSNSGEAEVEYDKIVAASKAGKNPGVDLTDAGFINELATEKLTQKLNTTNVPRLGRVQPALLQQVDYRAMPYRGSSVVLAYNSSVVKNPPTTLSGLLTWIKTHPGKFTYNTPSSGGSGDNFVTDVLMANVPSSDLNEFETGYKPSMEKLWDKGFKVLKGLNPYVYRQGYYPNGNTAVLRLLASGTIDIAPVWSDMALDGLADHLIPPTIHLEQINPPLAGGPADLAVLNSCKHKKQADEFLNWLLSKQAQTLIVNKMHGYPGVEWKYVSPAVQKEFAAIAQSYSFGFSNNFNNDMANQWQNKVPAGN